MGDFLVTCTRGKFGHDSILVRGNISKEQLIVSDQMIRRENIYSEYDVDYPLGIVRKASKDQYQIIDGNHRIMNNKN